MPECPDRALHEARIAELDRQVFELGALLRAAEAFHADLDVGSLCSRLAVLAKDRMRARHAGVLLAGRDGKSLELAHALGLSEAALGLEAQVEDGLLRQILLDGRPFQVTGLDGASRFTALPAELLGVLRAELWVPLVSKGNLVGILSLGGLPAYDGGADERQRAQEFLATLACHAAAALWSAQLARRTTLAGDELDRSLHKLSLLFDVTRALSAVSDLTGLLRLILDRAIDSVRAEKGSLMLLDERTDELVLRVVRGMHDKRLEYRINDGEVACARFRRGEGIAGRVLATGRTVRIDDVSTSGDFDPRGSAPVRSIVCAPLQADDDVIGVVNITNKRDGGVFSAGDEELLEALANQAALAISRTRLWEAAITDGLTQLYVRRFIMHRLKEEVRRARRYGTPLTLIMADIDHFKRVNDEHGHPAGDAVLAGCAQVVRQGLRDTVDLPGRYGGEEFLIVLPLTPAVSGMIVAERLLERVEATAFERTGGDPLSVTMSFGVAGFDPASPESSESLLARADRALYRSKGAGRNRVTLATGDEPPVHPSAPSLAAAPAAASEPAPGQRRRAGDSRPVSSRSQPGTRGSR